MSLGQHGLTHYLNCCVFCYVFVIEQCVGIKSLYEVIKGFFCTVLFGLHWHKIARTKVIKKL
jgi:hypothetical protein